MEAFKQQHQGSSVFSSANQSKRRFPRLRLHGWPLSCFSFWMLMQVVFICYVCLLPLVNGQLISTNQLILENVVYAPSSNNTSNLIYNAPVSIISRPAVNISGGLNGGISTTNGNTATSGSNSQTWVPDTLSWNPNQPPQQPVAAVLIESYVPLDSTLQNPAMITFVMAYFPDTTLSTSALEASAGFLTLISAINMIRGNIVLYTSPAAYAALGHSLGTLRVVSSLAVTSQSRDAYRSVNAQLTSVQSLIAVVPYATLDEYAPLAWPGGVAPGSTSTLIPFVWMLYNTVYNQLFLSSTSMYFYVDLFQFPLYAPVDQNTLTNPQLWPDMTLLQHFFDANLNMMPQQILVTRAANTNSTEYASITQGTTACIVHPAFASHFIGGTKKAIDWLAAEYYNLLQQMTQENCATIATENILTGLGYLHPQSLIFIDAYNFNNATETIFRNSPCNATIDSYHVEFFYPKEFRSCMINEYILPVAATFN